MKAVILAGGFGTRISEESVIRPKPMIEIGGRPILWHIMKIYSYYGITDFIICLGYKGYYIKEYFANYYLHESDITFDFREGNQQIIHTHHAEPWRVTLVDTGYETMTGGRLKRVKDYIGNETFMMTYGDGVSDINITKLLEYHRENRKKVTVTAIRPAGRYGALSIHEQSNIVNAFQEKPLGDGGCVSGGFFVFEPDVFGYITGDDTYLEREPLERMVKENEMIAYNHLGFWQSMDTMRDKKLLEELWNKGKAPWKVW
ncbi:glucose-1-phosphate cytidylyltransferase [Propionispira raffinosivorans]|uniref:glucose-1-phosphate cytidylyltransferase n=1 Tax=Propionispira raffinosivorans TaxID=86959 RepID=UPI0003667DE7|nr:glucose-1-phosphate cytidylyltransferase [Propionispira raffinosivorans]